MIEKTHSADTLGSCLRKAREKRRVSLAALSKETGISLKNLEALERGDLAALPDAVYVSGMLQKLARVLLVEEKELLGNLEKRLGRVGMDVPLVDALETHQTPAYLTPSRAALVLAIVVVMAVAAYVAWTLRPLWRAPYLAVEEPSSDMRVYGRQIAVAGSAEPASDLTVNGEAVYLDEEGNFRLDYVLYTGVNPIEVVSRNRFGKEAKVTRYVVYQPMP